MSVWFIHIRQDTKPLTFDVVVFFTLEKKNKTDELRIYIIKKENGKNKIER